jgi:hypothetical protein
MLQSQAIVIGRFENLGIYRVLIALICMNLLALCSILECYEYRLSISTASVLSPFILVPTNVGYVISITA